MTTTMMVPTTQKKKISFDRTIGRSVGRYASAQHKKCQRGNGVGLGFGLGLGLDMGNGTGEDTDTSVDSTRPPRAPATQE